MVCLGGLKKAGRGLRSAIYWSMRWQAVSASAMVVSISKYLYVPKRPRKETPEVVLACSI